MAKRDSGYFGMQIGDAIASGAGHIAQGLQRKYEIQRRDELRAQALEERKKQEELQARQQAFGTNLQLGAMGVDVTAHPYDPMNPEASLQYMQPYFKKKQEEQEANLDLIKSRAQIQGMKPPMGYRFTMDGELEPIPNGPADIKQKELSLKKEQAAKSYDLKIKNVKSTIDSALEQVGYTTAGLGGKILGGIGMTAPVDLEGALNTIKSNLGFDRLTQMRAESPTGGALGNVSDRELQLLTSTVQSLDQRQSPATLKKNLAIIKSYLDDTTDIRKTGNTMSPKSDPLGLFK